VTRTYIANAMSGMEKNNFPWFDRASAFLWERGVIPVSPADHDREQGLDENVHIEPYSDAWRARLRQDAGLIGGSDRIAFGPDWSNSAGAQLERRLAWELGIPFWRIDPDEQLFYPEMVFGCSGYAMVGKDSAADALENEGWTRRGFASALRDILYATNPLVEGHWPARRVAEIVDFCDWTESKKFPEIRELLQRLGTDAGRMVLGDEFWVRTLFERNTSDRIVIPDVRFPNEKRAIEDRGGIVIRIERDGYGPVNGHVSETALDDDEFKYVLQNDGSIPDLGEKVLEIVRQHYGPS
jgi:hypothetical protein